MTDLTPEQTVEQTYDPIHDIGSTIYTCAETRERAKAWGWTKGFTFYFAGRGGAMGDVHPDVVTAAFGWFSPAIVGPMYAEGVALHGAAEAVDRMFEAHALWGRDHLADLDLGRFVELADRLVDGVEGGGLPLFVGWRAQPRVDDVAGRAAQLLQILREWRGANHLVATTAVGLSPLEAILTNEGEGQAKFFGWAEPFPDVSADTKLHTQAEEITNRLCARQFEILSPSERGDFADGVGVARAALD